MHVKQTGLSNGWLANWAAKYTNSIKGIDHWSRHVTQLPESAWIVGKGFRQTQLILDPFPHAAGDHWLLISACSGAFDFWEKHSVIHSHTSLFPPRSILPHACTCQLHQTRMWLSGSVREVSFISHVGCGWALPLSLFIMSSVALFSSRIHSSILLCQINICHSETEAERKSIMAV